MTLKEITDALHAGKKITHDYFSDNEYVYLKNGKLVDEKNIVLIHDINRFFSQTRNGWKIYNN